MMTGNDLNRRSLWQVIQSCSGTQKDKLNVNRFVACSLVWAVTYVVAHRVLKADLELATPLVWLLVAVPILTAFAAVFSYLHFLRNVDELLRKIQLQGLALGFGAGVVFVTGYQLLESAGAAQMQADHLIMVMMFSWVAGQLYGMLRYR